MNRLLRSPKLFFGLCSNRPRWLCRLGGIIVAWDKCPALIKLTVGLQNASHRGGLISREPFIGVGNIRELNAVASKVLQVPVSVIATNLLNHNLHN